MAAETIRENAMRLPEGESEWNELWKEMELTQRLLSLVLFTSAS